MCEEMERRREKSPPVICNYKDSNQPVEARVQDLLSRMTLPEKIGQMTQIEKSGASPSALKHLAVGSVLSGGGSSPETGNSAVDWAEMTDSFQRSALESRLSIPIIYGVDAVHGHNNVFGATIFPHNIGLGAVREPELLRRIGAATALEVRATGISFAFAPCVSVSRDPRWGRCYESYSEDTRVVQEMTSIVSGLQGKPPPDLVRGYPYVHGRQNIVACAKHFVGDGGTTGGCNEGDTLATFEQLQNVHIRPFVDCLDQHVSTVMASYSSWNGSKCHSNYFLITQFLKGQLGFKGFVISDWEGIDRLCDPMGSDYRHCILSSINAGIDMVMVPNRFEQFIQDLTSLVEEKKISMERINDAVERILRVKFVAGLFEYPFADRSLLDSVGCLMHRELAREAVRKSLVLLKNGKDPKKPFLPLDKKARKILVAGQHANDLGYQCGGWTISWNGSSGKTTEGTTILDAIRAVMSEESEVIFEPEPSLEILQDSDISFAIVVVGEAPYAEWSGDNPSLDIPFSGSDLVENVCCHVQTLVILISGRPLVVEPLLEKTDAIVAAWLPGTEGEGVTDVIFGDYDFQGVLPRTWFRRVEQLSQNTGDESNNPLFPFGFGLTYALDLIY